MKKSTKRLISSILSVAMLFTSVVSTSVVTSATEYAESGSLDGFTVTTTADETSKTTTWTFATTIEKADDNLKITNGDVIGGIVVTGKGSKSWNSTNQFDVSNTMGFDVPISANCVSGTLTISCTGQDDSRYLALVSDDTRTIAYNKKVAQTFEFTSADVTDGYLCFTNENSSGDYKISQIILDEVLDPSITTTTTETTTVEDTTTTEATTVEDTTTEATTVEDTTTEATTVEDTTTEATTVEDTTEATTAADTTTEATTEAESSEATAEYTVVIGKDITSSIEKAATVYESDSVSIAAAQALSYVEDATAVEVGSNSYSGHLQSTGENTSATVDGTTANYRFAFAMTAKTDTTITVDCKVNDGKKVYIATKDETAVTTYDTTGYEGTYVSVASVDNSAASAPTYEAVTFDAVAGTTYYFIGAGTNVPIYGINVEADASSEETTTEATTEATTAGDTINIYASVSEGGSEEVDASLETVDVDFNISGNPGFNSYSFFITYNPEVVKASKVVANSSTTYVTTPNGAYAYDESVMNGQMTYVPTTDDTDYEGDGVKSAAELGKIKVAYYCGESDASGNLATVTGDGVLFTIQFEIIGEGDAEIALVSVGGGDLFAPSPSSSSTITATETENNITVVAAETTTTTTEETTEETSTEETTQDTTTATDKLSIQPVLNPTLDEDVTLIPVSYVGSTVNVDLKVSNNPGFNNYTFFVDYDPTVIEMVGVVDNADSIVSSTGNVAYDKDTITAQISNKPSSSNEDYTGLGADGTKTQAELGRVKFAWYCTDSSADYLVTGDGALVTLQFKVLQAGTDSYLPTDLKVTFVQDGFRPTLGASTVLDTESLDSGIVVDYEETTETTTESTTDSTTTTEETTTEDTTTTEETTTEDTTTTAADDTTTTTTTVTETTTETTTTTTTEDTETTTKKKSSSGGGGGSGSSSSKATTTTVAEVEDDDASTKTSLSSDSPSFTVLDKNGNTVTIKPPVGIVNTNVEFDDINDRPWATAAIRKLAQLGIIAGVGDNLYGVDLYCKRADFVIMINNVLGIGGTATQNFSDVAVGKYYYNAVGVSYEIGISSGYGDDTFKPENYCTREEMMVLVAKTFEFLGVDVTSTDESVLQKYNDHEDISWWSAPYTAYLTDEAIVTGTGSNFEPKVYMTRAQMAVMMAEVYDYVLDLAEERSATVEEVVEEQVDEVTDEDSEVETEEDSSEEILEEAETDDETDTDSEEE